MVRLLSFICLLIAPLGAYAQESNFAKANARFEALEEQIRQLNGKIEQLQYHIDTLDITVKKAIEDMDYRLNQQQLNTSAAPPTYSEEAPIDVSPTSLAPSTEAEEVPILSENTTDLYETAMAHMRAARYDKAERAFYNFVNQNPDNSLAGNAYYWLGETFFVRDLFEQSAVYFLKGYQSFPQGEKAPDSLLKLAMTFNSLEKPQEACASLDKLLSEFPELSDDLKTHVSSQKANSQC